MRKLWLCTVLAAGTSVACSHAPVQTGAAPSPAKTTADATEPGYFVLGVRDDAPPGNGITAPVAKTIPVAIETGYFLLGGVPLDASPASRVATPRTPEAPGYFILGIPVDTPPSP